MTAVTCETVDLIRACRRAIDQRFGWLKLELARAGGSMNALPPHYQTLWRGYIAVSNKFNRLSLERDIDKRERGYRKLIRELAR